MVAVLSPREKRVFGSGVNDSEAWSGSVARSDRVAKRDGSFTLRVNENGNTEVSFN